MMTANATGTTQAHSAKPRTNISSHNSSTQFKIDINKAPSAEEKKQFNDLMDIEVESADDDEQDYDPKEDEEEAAKGNSDYECDDLRLETNILKSLANELSADFNYDKYMKFRAQLDKKEREKDAKGNQRK
jgi:hypothetical protein